MSGQPGPVPSRVAVVGCGSIGSLLAAHLTTAGHDVTAVDGWYRHVEEIRDGGVEISSPDETVRVRVNARHPDEVPAISRGFDAVLVAVKAYDSAAAVALVGPLLREDTVVVPVQNGMNESWFGDLLPRGRLVGCSVHVPAELTAPGRVVRYLPRSRRTFTLGAPTGPADEPARRVAALLAPVGGTEVTEDLAAVKWAKLAVNTMTNAPAGITGWTTHRLWSDERSLPFVARAAGETLEVAAAAGVSTAPVFGRIDPATFRAGLRDAAAYDEVVAALGEMAQERTGTSESRPSLLQDVDRGRRTEVRWLNGYVVRAGAAHGVHTPVNAALERLVEDIDRGRLGPEPANLDQLADLVAQTSRQ